MRSLKLKFVTIFSLCKIRDEQRTFQTLFSHTCSKPINAAEGEEFTQTLHLAPFFARDQSLRGRVCETFKMESIKSKFGNFPLKTRTSNQPWFHTHANSDDSEHSKKVYMHCCVCRASKIGNFSNTCEPKDTRQF